MEDNLITTKEVGDYRIKVYYCRDSECPITNWGLFGSFFFEYSDTHRLHDECNWKTFFYDNKHDLRDVIDAIVMKHIKQKDIVKYLKKGEAIFRRLLIRSMMKNIRKKDGNLSTEMRRYVRSRKREKRYG